MTVNELEVEVELQNNILNVEVAGEEVFTHADRVKLNELIPISDEHIRSLFS